MPDLATFSISILASRGLKPTANSLSGLKPTGSIIAIEDLSSFLGSAWERVLEALPLVDNGARYNLKYTTIGIQENVP